MKINTALISTQDKTSAVELATFLSKKGVEIFSNSATSKAIEKAGGTCSDMSSLAGGQSANDILSGKLASISPLLLACLMANRKDNAEMEQLKTFGGKKIDLLVIDSLVQDDKQAPVKGKESKNDENKDLGRVHLVKAALSGIHDVAIIIGPENFKEFMDVMSQNGDAIPADYLKRLAVSAAEIVADMEIENFKLIAGETANKEFMQDTVYFKFKKSMDLRYGENPHQKAAFFTGNDTQGVTLKNIVKLKGPDMSLNNICDLNAALNIALEFEKDTVVIIKHGNPTAVTIDKDITKAYVRAREVDKVSAFGSTVVINSQVDKKTAKELTESFIEVLAAPRYTDGALDFLKKAKKATHMRIVEIKSDKWARASGSIDIRTVMGGVVIQETDDMLVPENGQIQLVTKRKPTRKELSDLVIAWKVCKHVRSNAIVLVKNQMTLGIGAGQMSRLDSLKIAIEKAGEEVVGCAMASDAYFPFTNVVDEAASHGISTIIQPGGSRRDDEIIASCDKHNIALCVTGMRHFKH